MLNYARWFRAALFGSSALLVSVVTSAQELYVRVVDVGAGECVVIKAPGIDGDHYMVYDAGHWKDAGKTAMDAIRQIIPRDSTIDLLVLSHSDGDHLGAVPEITDEYFVKRIIHSGYKRTTKVWNESKDAIANEVTEDGCHEINLATEDIEPGKYYTIGKARATFVAGFHKPPTNWGRLSKSEERNAGSIVFRLTYKGKSILLCGDAVGRHSDDENQDACIAIEKLMVGNEDEVTIDSDVIVAPHHGADNGSSKPFITRVSPEYVIFSSGHEYEHPRKAAAERYLSIGVSAQKMFRTDRGDNEGGKEWGEQGGNSPDQAGDDDVEIRISVSGQIAVKYRNQ